MGEVEYEADKRALRQFLCDYFNAQTSCDRKLGNSISPVDGAEVGTKRLKVRWALPGGGKSGGLRLLVDAHCSKKVVTLRHAELRKEIKA
ncbi:MAG: hypothetical protein HY874_00045 [Chloroflexi bacterium]|nr:hypothetical protein [Chloroflexota bacterium]